MKIIYIAPNPLKGSRRFTKSVTATIHHKSSTIKYKHIHCLLMHTNESKETQIQRWDLKRWVLRSFLNWLSLLASLICDGNEFQIYGAQCLKAFSVHFLLALGGIFNRFWEPDLNRRLGTYCSKRSLKYDGAVLFIHLKLKTQIL